MYNDHERRLKEQAQEERREKRRQERKEKHKQEHLERIELTKPILVTTDAERLDIPRTLLRNPHGLWYLADFIENEESILTSTTGKKTGQKDLARFAMISPYLYKVFAFFRAKRKYQLEVHAISASRDPSWSIMADDDGYQTANYYITIFRKIDWWRAQITPDLRAGLPPSIKSFAEAERRYDAEVIQPQQEATRQEQEAKEKQAKLAKLWVNLQEEEPCSIALIVVAGHKDFGISDLRFLLENGGNINSQSIGGYTPPRGEEANRKKYHQYVIPRNLERNTPLHRAITSGNRDFTEFMLKNRADPGLQNALGNTALHDAAGWHNDTFVRVLFNKSYNDTFDMQPVVNIQNNEGQTALHIAAAGKKQSIVNFLLEKGADRNILDKQGRSYGMMN
ncbi:MAG: ankyrin repeat domain-containing protein [Proteobacteria bacterium]|nr:ankyrin repeat domain-containing protein [Pseudomonadota bacterium]